MAHIDDTGIGELESIKIHFAGVPSTKWVSGRWVSQFKTLKQIEGQCNH
jgi:hypothetical protein